MPPAAIFEADEHASDSTAKVGLRLRVIAPLMPVNDETRLRKRLGMVEDHRCDAIASEIIRCGGREVAKRGD